MWLVGEAGVGGCGLVKRVYSTPKIVKNLLLFVGHIPQVPGSNNNTGFDVLVGLY